MVRKEKENENLQNEDIDLNIDIQNDLREIVKAISEFQTRLQLIVRTYVKASGKNGEYRISKDFTQLELMKKN